MSWDQRHTNRETGTGVWNPSHLLGERKTQRRTRAAGYQGGTAAGYASGYGAAAATYPTNYPSSCQTNTRIWGYLSKLFWVVAATAILAGSWQAIGTNAYTWWAQLQMRLSETETGILVEGLGAAENPTIVTSVRGGGTPPAEVAYAAPGEHFGRIQIPAIGVDHAVVVGVGEAQLKKGPGWVIGSAYAGRAGNMVISGHRTTYGAPFNRLDELKVGDQIRVEAPGVAGGVAIYEVRDIFIVTPDDTWVADPTDGARITLTTCHPKGSRRQRLIVQGELISGGEASKALTASEWMRSQPSS